LRALERCHVSSKSPLKVEDRAEDVAEEKGVSLDRGVIALLRNPKKNEVCFSQYCILPVLQYSKYGRHNV